MRQVQCRIPGKGEEAWQRARSGEELQRFPNFYVHCPARTDPTAAPDGRDSVMVLLPVANMQESGTGTPRLRRPPRALSCVINACAALSDIHNPVRPLLIAPSLPGLADKLPQALR